MIAATSAEAATARRLFLAGLRALSVGVVPAGLALLFATYLVPPRGAGGFTGLVAETAGRAPLWVGVGVFFVVSAIVRHWWGRYAPARPAGAVVARSRREEILASVALAVLAAVAALAMRGYGARPYRVIGPSMLPTLEPGDVVAGRMAAPPPALQRGDVVVLESGLLRRRGAADDEAIVKRVIGLPGDRIGMRGSTPVINGWTVPTCDAGEYLYVLPDGPEGAIHGRLRVEFLDERAYLTVAGAAAPFADYLVAPGELFVLGDDRSASVDSRAFGGAPLEAAAARIERFLVGTHRAGDADFGRLLRPLDTMQARVRLEGLESTQLADGVARCLEQRPAGTRPPPPSPL